jgi:hypothetical protein
MIMRSRSRLSKFASVGECRSPTPGPRRKAVLPRPGGAGRPGPDIDCRGRSAQHSDRPVDSRGQVERESESNNYWSSSTYQNNPSNAWNVNFNDGNTNNNNKTNNRRVRAVRAGS